MMKYGSHNFLEPSGPVETCTGVGFTDSLVMSDINKNPPLSGVRSSIPIGILIPLCDELGLDIEVVRNCFSGLAKLNKRSIYWCQMTQRKPEAGAMA
jgi:hypothetical protein